MEALVALALLLPFAALGALALPRLLPFALPIAPLPLVLLGLSGGIEARLPLALLNLDFATDAVNRPLLLLAGTGWMLAGAFVSASVNERRPGFGACWLLTLGGQCIALLGAELVSFYLGYVTMTIAAYGLVVHERTHEAWRAGRIYIVLAIFGEALILSGLLMLGALYGNAAFSALHAAPPAALPSLLLLGGFAVKVGLAPLHVWLPLAHPVAPVPASAVLSGLIVKTGLLGMLRFVVPEAMPSAETMLALGLFTAAYGAVVGLVQVRLKTVLAYSTVSQMGLAVAGLAALQHAGETALAALALFAMHHGMNKIALFLAAGHRVGGWTQRLLFLLPAAALAGLPLTSGALAKSALKDALDAAGAGPWLIGLSLSSALTTMLLLHAYKLARSQQKGLERAHPAWICAVAAGVLLPWWLAVRGGSPPPIPGVIVDAVWPVALGAVLFALGRSMSQRMQQRVPEGDLAVVLEACARRVIGVSARIMSAWTAWQPRLPDLTPDAERLRRVENALGRLPVAGLCMLLVLLVLAMV
jgi:formate hydrogenlyase subunit 3/multisubunit Na+/H+ antiporter MnhD subunit